MGYVLHLLTMYLLLALLACAVNTAAGYARLLSVGHAAIFGAGAYVSAILLLRHVMAWLWSVVVSAFAGAIIGVVLGAFTLRLAGDYFLMATLGLGEILHGVMMNATQLTNGPVGLMNVPSPWIGPWVASDSARVLLIYSAMVLPVIGFLLLLERSPFGRVLRAIGDDELGAQVCGKRTRRVKTVALSISGAVAGLAGALFGSYVSYIDPSSFMTDESVRLLAMVVLGGLGNVYGACAGAAVVLFLPEALRFAGLPSMPAAQLQQIVFGAALIGMTTLRVRGLAPQKTLIYAGGQR